MSGYQNVCKITHFFVRKLNDPIVQKENHFVLKINLIVLKRNFFVPKIEYLFSHKCWLQEENTHIIIWDEHLFVWLNLTKFEILGNGQREIKVLAMAQIFLWKCYKIYSWLYFQSFHISKHSNGFYFCMWPCYRNSQGCSIYILIHQRTCDLNEKDGKQYKYNDRTEMAI